MVDSSGRRRHAGIGRGAAFVGLLLVGCLPLVAAPSAAVSPVPDCAGELLRVRGEGPELRYRFRCSGGFRARAYRGTASKAGSASDRARPDFACEQRTRRRFRCEGRARDAELIGGRFEPSRRRPCRGEPLAIRFRVRGRAVDGSAIRDRLRLTLRCP